MIMERITHTLVLILLLHFVNPKPNPQNTQKEVLNLHRLTIEDKAEDQCPLSMNLTTATVLNKLSTLNTLIQVIKPYSFSDREKITKHLLKLSLKNWLTLSILTTCLLTTLITLMFRNCSRTFTGIFGDLADEIIKPGDNPKLADAKTIIRARRNRVEIDLTSQRFKTVINFGLAIVLSFFIFFAASWFLNLWAISRKAVHFKCLLDKSVLYLEDGIFENEKKFIGLQNMRSLLGAYYKDYESLYANKGRVEEVLKAQNFTEKFEIFEKSISELYHKNVDRMIDSCVYEEVRTITDSFMRLDSYLTKTLALEIEEFKKEAKSIKKAITSIKRLKPPAQFRAAVNQMLMEINTLLMIMVDTRNRYNKNSGVLFTVLSATFLTGCISCIIWALLNVIFYYPIVAFRQVKRAPGAYQWLHSLLTLSAAVCVLAVGFQLMINSGIISVCIVGKSIALDGQNSLMARETRGFFICKTPEIADITNLIKTLQHLDSHWRVFVDGDAVLQRLNQKIKIDGKVQNLNTLKCTSGLKGYYLELEMMLKEQNDDFGDSRMDSPLHALNKINSIGGCLDEYYTLKSESCTDRRVDLNNDRCIVVGEVSEEVMKQRMEWEMLHLRTDCQTKLGAFSRLKNCLKQHKDSIESLRVGLLDLLPAVSEVLKHAEIFNKELEKIQKFTPNTTELIKRVNMTLSYNCSEVESFFLKLFSEGCSDSLKELSVATIHAFITVILMSMATSITCFHVLRQGVKARRELLTLKESQLFEKTLMKGSKIKSEAAIGGTSLLLDSKTTSKKIEFVQKQKSKGSNNISESGLESSSLAHHVGGIGNYSKLRKVGRGVSRPAGGVVRIGKGRRRKKVEMVQDVLKKSEKSSSGGGTGSNEEKQLEVRLTKLTK